MERIIIVRRETTKDKPIAVRFRLRDGRGVDLFHKTDIKATAKDLAKFEEDGSIRAKVTIYNHQLKDEIDHELAWLHTAYANLCERIDKTHITSGMLDEEFKKLAKPDEIPTAPKENLVDRFTRFIETAYKQNHFNERRMKHYLFVRDSVNRFMTIRHYDKITPDEFTADMLADLADYFRDEYKYVDKHKRLFKGLNKNGLPMAQRQKNTVVTWMNKIQALFNDLVERGEIEVSPFHKLGRKRKADMMRETYDDPRFLRKDEFLRVLHTEVPATLLETKEAFVVQCAIGCRISDFQNLSMDKVAVSDDGIPYIHYLPRKTLRENLKKSEIETPLMGFALEIIKKRQFSFPILNYAGGKSGYNIKIRELLEHCGIDRPVKTFDEEKQDNVFSPLYLFGSSKICRATHVDMMRKVQIDLYAAGLHSRGSEAVHHYTMEELRDRFALMCVAFGQPIYKVDKDFNIIE